MASALGIKNYCFTINFIVFNFNQFNLNGYNFKLLLKVTLVENSYQFPLTVRTEAIVIDPRAGNGSCLTSEALVLESKTLISLAVQCHNPLP